MRYVLITLQNSVSIFVCTVNFVNAIYCTQKSWTGHVVHLWVFHRESTPTQLIVGLHFRV